MPTLKSIKNISYFTKGRRGIIYKGQYKNKIVVIKEERKDTFSMGRIENEVRYLKILNDKGMGPRLLFYDKNFTYFVCEYIDGDFFPLFVENERSKRLIKKIIKDIFLQCYEMDRINLDKEEMHRPYKHIIIEKNKPVLIDFERCRKTLDPRNVTQFSSYLISGAIMSSLKEKDINVNKEDIIKAARAYKENINKENLNKIIKHIR